jgi:hypothetical protein
VPGVSVIIVTVTVIYILVFSTKTATIAVLLLLLSSTLFTASILLHIRDRSTDTEGITAPRCTFQPFRFPADNHMLPGNALYGQQFVFIFHPAVPSLFVPSLPCPPLLSPSLLSPASSSPPLPSSQTCFERVTWQ